MNRIFTIDGLTLRPGEEPVTARLREAGFDAMSVWKQLWSGVPRNERRWRLENPRVGCLDEELEIYPCLDGYLDPDRRWQTECTVIVIEGRIQRILVEVIDGVYAAGNFFERFVQTATGTVGEPLVADRRRARWKLPEGALLALYDRHAYRAEFSLLDASIEAMDCAE